MHKLDRPGAPGCLSKFRPGQHQWRDLDSGDKQEIRTQLAAMQGARCAYCEVGLKIGDAEGHIEHFEQRRRVPNKTFDWLNLFGSCDRQDSCGKHKDSLVDTYQTADLIKPDVDDPDDYLRFLSDGRIVPLEGLDQMAQQRAEETLRVFNLDHDRGRLRQMRHRELSGYSRMLEDVQVAAELSAELYAEALSYLQGELLATEGKPFETAIRHVLTLP